MILVNRHMTLQYRRVELEKGSNGVPVLERPWFFKDTQDYAPGGHPWNEYTLDRSYLQVYSISGAPELHEDLHA